MSRRIHRTPGGQRRSGSGAYCKGVSTGKRLQGPGGMYGGPRTVWRPIATAPKDGTPIQARIPGHGEDNIIAWWGGLVGEGGDECSAWTMVEDQEPPDCWTDGVCWAVNEDGLPSAQPTHWKPLYGGPSTAPEPQKEEAENDDEN